MNIKETNMNIRDYLRVIKKRRDIALLFFALTFFIVLVGTLISTPIYKASTQLLVEKNESAPLLGGRYYRRSDPEFYETQIQLIKSLNVARRVVKILSLEKTYDAYFPKKEGKDRLSILKHMIVKYIINWPKELFASIKQPVSTVNNKNEEKSIQNIIAEEIKLGMTVRPVKNSKLLNISYQSKNPEFAKIIADTIATAYIEELMAIQLNTSGHAIKWMTQKAEEEKEKLANAETALQEFMREQDIITIEDRITIIPQKLSDYTAQLSNAEAKRKELETIYNQIVRLQNRHADLETIPTLAANRVLQSYRDQVREAEKQILELSRKYGEKHPVMKNARSELEILKGKNKQEVEKIIEAIKHEYELAKSKEDDVRVSLAKTKKEAITLNEKFIRYGILKREVETYQAVFKALKMRIKEQGITGETDNVDVWITEAAELPKFPVKPRKTLNILMGIVVGIFGGIGLVFFLEYLDNTIKEPDDIEAKSGLAVIGVIPLFDPKWGNDIEVASHQKPFSPFAESFKNLRSSILLSAADTPPKSLLITSMSPAEGKSTIVANLAIAVAQANYKVLLIDADMRKPTIHKYFKIQNVKGLSSYLAGAGDTDIIQTITESDLNIVQLGPISSLNIIPSGPIPPNPSELLVSNKFKELLEKNRRKFDFIIFDSPPILGATDGLVVSKIVDGTIIVGLANKTTFEMIHQGMKCFTDINSNILGMVMNGMDISKSKYNYYYGYYNQDSQ